MPKREDENRLKDRQEKVKKAVLKFMVALLSALKTTTIVSVKTYLAFGVLGYITAPIPPLQFWIRFAGYHLLVMGHGLFGGLLGLVFPLIGLRDYIVWTIARTHALFAPFITGLRFRVTGTENLKDLHTNPAILAMNHQTAMDIQVLGNWFPMSTTIVVKNTLLYTPGLGQFLLGMRAIPLVRNNRESSMDALTKVARRMRHEGLSTAIFPEGTRRNIAALELQKFKLGAFLTAIPEKLPIIPVVVQNYFSGVDLKGHRWPGGTFNVDILPSVSSAGYDMSNEGARQLATRVQSIMQDRLVAMSK